MEWELESSGGSCAACGSEFADREEYYSSLYTLDDGFERRDCCVGCWAGPDAAALSFWRARARREPDPPKRFVNDEVMLEFFDRLTEADDPARRRLAFIMAVLLLRKRLLREKGRRRGDAGVFWLLRCPVNDREYEVLDQGLTGEETIELMNQIGRVLNLKVSELPADSPGEEG